MPFPLWIIQPTRSEQNVKYGLTLPPIGPYSDPNTLSDLAVEAEQAGWDGFFLWDHFIYFSPYEPKVPMHPFTDPWVALAAVAVKTKRVKIGPMVTSLARRRPWKVARETVSLDLLSNGRLIMGVGLGASSSIEWCGTVRPKPLSTWCRTGERQAMTRQRLPRSSPHLQCSA
jgi:alkanesulfonate monooxygenase SsuD/methylene tetrahydromethanopterin reductase-like flavin-dependent oxidoreductase (luciferase family)